jgi:hypothetical protein
MPFHGSGGQLPAFHRYGPGLIQGLIHMTFVVDKVALGQVFLQVLRFSPVSIIPPMLHTHLLLHAFLNRRRNNETWEPSKSNALLELGGH